MGEKEEKGKKEGRWKEGGGRRRKGGREEGMNSVDIELGSECES